MTNRDKALRWTTVVLGAVCFGVIMEMRSTFTGIATRAAVAAVAGAVLATALILVQKRD